MRGGQPPLYEWYCKAQPTKQMCRLRQLPEGVLPANDNQNFPVQQFNRKSAGNIGIRVQRSTLNIQRSSRPAPGNPEPQLGQQQPPEGGTTNESMPLSNSQLPISIPAYVCPMPEHLSVTYKQPGNCLLCGMALVPVSAELLAKLQPGAAVDHYTCPMPEHADVRAAKPGKCPKCGMTLVPVMQQEKAEGKRLKAEGEMQNAEQGTTGAVQHATHNAQPETAVVWYVCPMPEDNIRQDHPGKCPKCGMKLVPEKK